MSEAAEQTSLVAKLLKVRQAVRRVSKRGWNDHHKYHYATEADVKKAVRRALDREGIFVLPMVTGAVEHHGTLTTVPMTFRFIDAATGETLDQPWAGVGFDKGGDKGIYKAFTGATKYAQLCAFLIETGEGSDPERDDASEGGRTAAPPRIPQDRAKTIAAAAVEAGLAEGAGRDFKAGPVLTAKLHDLGVRKVGSLNVDQAEALEAFIASESDTTT